jgi:hypothetical protein
LRSAKFVHLNLDANASSTRISDDEAAWLFVTHDVEERIARENG